MSRIQHTRDAALLVETLRMQPTWSVEVVRSEWASANALHIVQLAVREGAALWLHRRLGVLGLTIQASARDVLSAAVKPATVQCLRVDAEFETTRALLRGAGVECIPLKGVAMRAMTQRIPYADARAPSDVDILCRETDARRAWTLLREVGYSSPKSAPEDGHHLPALVGRNGIGVDIHVTTVPAVSPDEAWHRASVVPRDTELLWHALSHSLAAIDIVAHTSLRLRHWVDAAALIAAGGNIDWSCIIERLASTECAYPMLGRAWLRVAFELAGREVPSDFHGTFPQLDLVRLLAWRLPIAQGERSRWREKLLEEGTRGEAGLPLELAGRDRHVLVRARHRLASTVARSYWQLSAR